MVLVMVSALNAVSISSTNGFIKFVPIKECVRKEYDPEIQLQPSVEPRTILLRKY